jgi:hypothetical protein
VNLCEFVFVNFCVWICVDFSGCISLFVLFVRVDLCVFVFVCVFGVFLCVNREKVQNCTVP